MFMDRRKPSLRCGHQGQSRVKIHSDGRLLAASLYNYYA